MPQLFLDFQVFLVSLLVLLHLVAPNHLSHRGFLSDQELLYFL